MKSFFLILILLISNPSFSQSRKKTKKFRKSINSLTLVKGTITQSFSYCGGAPPPQEMLDELARPKPFPSLTLYLRKDKNNLANPILYEVKTDDLGRFSINLPLGKYSVVDEKKKDSIIYFANLEKYKTANRLTDKIDQACYLNYFQTPDFVIDNQRKQLTKSVEFNYHRSCSWSGNPCVEFRGELPQ